MPSILYDAHNGRLAAGHVWTVEPWDWDKRDIGFAYLRYYSAVVDEVYDCPRDESHETGRVWRSLEVELFGGNRLVSLDWEWGAVSGEFAAQLGSSGLTGFAIGDAVKIYENQSDLENPMLALLNVMGDGGLNNRYRVKGDPTVCPYCDSEPLVCPACSNLLQKCSVHGNVIRPELTESNLGQWLFYSKGAPKQYVVDGRNWDGADFFKVRGTSDTLFVSERARKWLAGIGATGFDLKPALLDIEGAEERFAER
jgi:hypothetical protein